MTMTRLTKEHRALIVREMMRKTKFKARFAREFERLGVALRAAYVQSLEVRQGKELIDYIERMKPVYRKWLCLEIRNACDSAYRDSLRKVAPNLAEMVGRDHDDGYQDAAFFVPGAENGKTLCVKFSRPVWRPSCFYDDFFFADRGDSRKLLMSANALAAEFMQTVKSLEVFLYSVTTLDKLKELMPEAAALVPEASFPVAVIPNAGNALAALTRAGYFEQEKEVAHHG
jgi:hypothetical protein